MQGAGVLCLMDIAAGMEHLHSLGVLHVSLLCCSPMQTLHDSGMVDQSLTSSEYGARCLVCDCSL